MCVNLGGDLRVRGRSLGAEDDRHQHNSCVHHAGSGSERAGDIDDVKRRGKVEGALRITNRPRDRYPV